MINIRMLRSSELDLAKQFIRTIFPRAMVQITDDDTILLAEEDEKLVGFAHIIDDGERVILQGIGVEKSMRGQGVGTLLIEHTMEMLSEIERPIFLKVKVMNPAIDLYARYGFFIKKFGTTHVLVKKPNT
ncbi:MAG: GNAT family N-acetyltransferase [Candidatus Micrarchaeota archaeon]|nr:GNAT family N-acetyltransferase [Candidatus Micrarchaeota archaeon]MBU1681636.1 GNAT family N-acetyltransferase [Candidatus Micrarchaeota archaeon]